MMATIKVRSAFACEDIRTENNGKMLFIGVLNPIFTTKKRGPIEDAKPIKTHFVVSIDVPDPGSYQLIFRARSLRSTKGRTITMTVNFSHSAANVPFPIGPFPVFLGDEDTGFKLEQKIGERWKMISTWFVEQDGEE